MIWYVKVTMSIPVSLRLTCLFDIPYLCYITPVSISMQIRSTHHFHMSIQLSSEMYQLVPSAIIFIHVYIIM